MNREQQNWRELCEAASKERDSQRLLDLISELMKALDERRVVTGHSPAP
jgi:hypothetical protein